MIPVFDIHRQNKQIGQEIDLAIKRVIDSGVFILGKEVAAFEEEFAHYIGIKYAVGLASGTDAITLALLSLGIGLGDEVVVPANSYPSVFGVSSSGAIPRLVDVDPTTYTLDPQRIEKALTNKVKAILAVAMYGQTADMETILKIGKKYSLAVIEDCAQAHGAKYKLNNAWKKLGTMGDAGCFSFYPTKNLGCFGDGGMVVTNNEEIAKKVRLLRMYGEESRYHSVIVGRNSRLDEMQAAILRVKLKHLDKWNQRRRKIAQLYKSQISSANWRIKSQNHNLNVKSFDLQLPYETDNTKHIYHLFVIRSKQRNRLKAYLQEKGIGTGIHYPTSIHTTPSFSFLGYKKGDFPESERISNEVLSLPMFPELRKREVKEVVEAVIGFYSGT